MSRTEHEQPRTVLGPWPTFLAKSRPSLDLTRLGLVLCLDPGLTTGWALFEEGLLVACGQVPTPGPEEMANFIWHVHESDAWAGPFERIVFEEYRIRGNKAKEHVGSEVVTIQLIGAIKVAAAELQVPLWKQTAGQVKAFATDRKLRHWGLFQTGKKHANDAIRHGVYYILFVSGRTK